MCRCAIHTLIEIFCARRPHDFGDADDLLSVSSRAGSPSPGPAAVIFPPKHENERASPRASYPALRLSSRRATDQQQRLCSTVASASAPAASPTLLTRIWPAVDVESWTACESECDNATISDIYSVVRSSIFTWLSFASCPNDPVPASNLTRLQILRTYVS